MYSFFDHYLVLLSIVWALYIILKNLNKKSLTCNSPCTKKIFNKNSVLVNIRRKN